MNRPADVPPLRYYDLSYPALARLAVLPTASPSLALLLATAVYFGKSAWLARQEREPGIQAGPRFMVGAYVSVAEVKAAGITVGHFDRCIDQHEIVVVVDGTPEELGWRPPLPGTCPDPVERKTQP